VQRRKISEIPGAVDRRTFAAFEFTCLHCAERAHPHVRLLLDECSRGGPAAVSVSEPAGDWPAHLKVGPGLLELLVDLGVRSRRKAALASRGACRLQPPVAIRARKDRASVRPGSCQAAGSPASGARPRHTSLRARWPPRPCLLERLSERYGSGSPEDAETERPAITRPEERQVTPVDRTRHVRRQRGRPHELVLGSPSSCGTGRAPAVQQGEHRARRQGRDGGAQQAPITARPSGASVRHLHRARAPCTIPMHGEGGMRTGGTRVAA